MTRIFAEIKAELVPMIAELRERDIDASFLTADFSVEKQQELAYEIIDLFGHRPDTWRIDPTEHPFASGTGIDDIRITTHYYPDSLESLFSTMHEYGHGLYEHQIRRDIARLPIGNSSSLGIHESQSRLWENLVGRSEPFWRFFYPRLQEYFPSQFGGVDRETFLTAVNKVEPSLIRIRADEVTYGMHVILRFELEQDIINGRVELSDLPRIWNERMEEYLGIEVPDNAHGVLQDVHWSAGLIGYFSTYLLGTVMSVQLWEKLVSDVGDVDGADGARRVRRDPRVARRERARERPQVPAAGDAATSRGLDDRREAVPRVSEAEVRRRGSRVASGLRFTRPTRPRSSRKYPPQETLRRAVGSTIDAKPYLAYLKRKYGVAVPA